MVLTFGNGQIWLGTPPVVLQFILVFFLVCGLQQGRSQDFSKGGG